MVNYVQVYRKSHQTNYDSVEKGVIYTFQQGPVVAQNKFFEHLLHKNATDHSPNHTHQLQPKIVYSKITYNRGISNNLSLPHSLTYIDIHSLTLYVIYVIIIKKCNSNNTINIIMYDVCIYHSFKIKRTKLMHTRTLIFSYKCSKTSWK